MRVNTELLYREMAAGCVTAADLKRYLGGKR